MSQRSSPLAPLVAALLVVISLFMTGIAPAVAQSEGRIGGIVFEDINGNGIREQGEEGLDDIEVKFDSGGWSTTLSTADSGAFSFDANPATWTVTVLPPAGYSAPKASVEVFIDQPGDAVTNLEFGLVPSEGGEVLPASGGVVSEGVLIGALFGLLVVGLVVIAVGQIRSKRDFS